jgi:hypothetical protein
MTKGEMFAGCADQSLLNDLASQSTSCGKYGTHGRTHCGRCVPCLIRRAAFNASHVPDRTEYKFQDLAIRDPQHYLYDDVQAMRYAVHQMRNGRFDEWATGSISSAQLGNTSPYLGIARRGLDEAATFLHSLGI